MKKYIIIEADFNDGDYTTDYRVITDEEIVRVKEILAKMPRRKDYLGRELSSIPYETRDIGKDDKEDSKYQYISFEEKNFLGRFLPWGNPTISGIHSITRVIIVQELEQIL